MDIFSYKAILAVVALWKKGGTFTFLSTFKTETTFIKMAVYKSDPISYIVYTVTPMPISSSEMA